MQTTDILALLPARLEWVVFFRLRAIERFAPPEVVRRMFFLDPQEDLSRHSHVVLTAEGRYLAPVQGEALRPANDEPPLQLAAGEATLLGTQGARLAQLPADEADCIGIGRRDADVALLHVRLGESHGDAQALLAAPPQPTGYDLLPVIGVDYLGGEPVDGGWRARFRNRLGTHIKAGQLSGFSRTHNCNVFFIEQAQIGPELARGLAGAFADRLQWARAAVAEYLHQAAGKALAAPLSMTCLPPAPQAPFAYGDLVPLGFLARGMQALAPFDVTLPPLAATLRAQRRTQLARLLDARRIDGLWPFHTGRLVTCTDSALVMLGHGNAADCEALERFADRQGGYLPQLASAEAAAGHMQADRSNAHWRQADAGTTCLVRAWRRRFGLPVRTPAAWLAERFDTRSALYFANPWLVDWCFAMAMAGDDALAGLRRRLRRDVLDSANPDGSFGRWDTCLSTALAVLCLDALGERGRALRLAQVRLMNMVDAGPLPATTPFYSTFLEDTPGAPSLLQVGGTWHALSLYEDTHRLVLAGLVAAALAVQAQVDEAEPLPGGGTPHPRYACDSAADYIARFALPPYLQARTGQPAAA